MAALQIKKHKVFLGSQDTQYVLTSHIKKKKERNKACSKHTPNLQHR